MELQRLIQKDLFAGLGVAETGDSEVIVLDLADRLSVQAIYDVQAPAAKTFDSGVAAVLVNQGVTYTANTRGTAGNSITITLLDPGVTSSLSIQVTTTAIAVTLGYAVGAITTTATQLVTALNLDAGVAALLTASGAGASPVTALATTPLATGTNSEVNTTTNAVSIPTHGFSTGFKVRLTTTGTLPATLALATDYFVIVVDADTIQFATSYANALAGTAVDLTNQGSDGAVNTATGVALAGASISYYGSNTESGDNWTILQTATSITVDGSSWFPPRDTAQSPLTLRRFKCVKAITAGVVDLKAYVLVVGGTA